MFICAITKRSSQSGEKCNKLVLATRDKIYTEKVYEEGQEIEIEIGRGWEIVKEIRVSDAGMDIWNNWSETERQFFTKSV